MPKILQVSPTVEICASIQRASFKGQWKVKDEVFRGAWDTVGERGGDGFVTLELNC